MTDIEINTVDAFQGREKDIIIFNCVRSNMLNTLQGSLGFLIDERRLNVAITRPRHFLFMVGNSQTLHKSPLWRDMVESCQSAQAAGGFFALEQDSGHYNERVIG